MNAQIRINGKNHYIGLFDTAEEASVAYLARAAAERGKFARVSS